MYKFKIIFIIFSLLFSYSCSKETENIKLIKETDQKVEMISAYEKGMDLIEIGDYGNDNNDNIGENKNNNDNSSITQT